MKQHGLDVHVVSSDGDLLDEFGRAEGVLTHSVAMTRRISPLRDAVALLRLINLFRALRPAIVHAHTPKAGLLGMIAARAARVPVRFYHIHGLPLVTTSGIRRALLRRAEAVACACATRVLCVSSSIRRTAIAERVVDSGKATVLCSGSINGVDAQNHYNPVRFPSETRARIREELGIPANAHVISFVGRIVREKGIVELFHAWKHIRAAGMDVYLVLVGPVEETDPIPVDIARDISEDDHVVCPGFVEDPAPLYAITDVLALPTYREGFGLAVIEAGALEVPVVASNVDGCVDSLVDGETGVLVPPRDPAALAAALKRYLEDPELRRLHGRAGRYRALHLFAPDRLWRAQLAEYEASLS